MANGNNNLVKYMMNPRGFMLKQWFADILKDKFVDHQNIVERVATSLVTDKDVADFGALITKIYEAGYYKAIEDYKAQAEKSGVQITVVNQSSG